MCIRDRRKWGDEKKSGKKRVEEKTRRDMNELSGCGYIIAHGRIVESTKVIYFELDM